MQDPSPGIDGWSTRRIVTVGAVAAACFLALWPMQRADWLDPMNGAVGAVLYDGLRHDVSYEAHCVDGLCTYEEVGGGLKYKAYTSKPIRNGTWNETHVVRESILPWAGIPLGMGAEEAAMTAAVATVALLLAFGAWRSAIVVAAVATVGGYLVGPLKYGGPWAPYPSGHTIGATMMWGLFLLLAVRTARRSGKDLWPNAERIALTAWAVLGLAVGLDLVNSGYHVFSDILLGWSYSVAMVFLALGLDKAWEGRRILRMSAPRPQDP